MSSPTLFGSVWRYHGVSARLHPRAIAVNLTLLSLLVGLAIWSVSAGDFPLAPGDLVRTLFGMGEGSSGFIVFGLRLPRLLTGTFAGMALGMAGALFQSLARNPLASPDIIGFDSGAALGAVTMVILLARLAPLLPPAPSSAVSSPPSLCSSSPGGARSPRCGWCWSASASASSPTPGSTSS